MPVCNVLASPTATSAATPFPFSCRFFFCRSPYRSFLAGANSGLWEQWISASAASRQTPSVFGVFRIRMSFSVVVAVVVIVHDEFLEGKPVFVRMHLVPDGRRIVLADVEPIGFRLIPQFAHPASLPIDAAVDQRQGMVAGRDVAFVEQEEPVQPVDHAADR